MMCSGKCIGVIEQLRAELEEARERCADTHESKADFFRACEELTAARADNEALRGRLCDAEQLLRGARMGLPVDSAIVAEIEDFIGPPIAAMPATEPRREAHKIPSSKDLADRCSYTYRAAEFRHARPGQQCRASRKEHEQGEWSHEFLPGYIHSSDCNTIPDDLGRAGPCCCGPNRAKETPVHDPAPASAQGTTGPTYNHTRGDGEWAPCGECVRAIVGRGPLAELLVILCSRLDDIESDRREAHSITELSGDVTALSDLAKALDKRLAALREDFDAHYHVDKNRRPEPPQPAPAERHAFENPANGQGGCCSDMTPKEPRYSRCGQPRSAAIHGETAK